MKNTGIPVKDTSAEDNNTGLIKKPIILIGRQGTARPLDGRSQKEVQVGPDKLEVVASFCYLGDMLSAAGGCELSTTTRVKTAWKKFKDLLPVLSSGHLSFKTRGRVYSSCVRSAMLHASETWPLTKPKLQRLQRNDRAMIRQICNVRPQDIVTTRSNELLVRLGIEDRLSTLMIDVPGDLV